jgi:CRP/FNR family transcriptional regulator, nitrogen fixation regulation protein
MFFVVSGVVCSCKVCESGTRNVVAFYLPGDLLGWSDLKHSLSIEAATDTAVLFLKRNALLSLATRDSRVASYLLSATTDQLERAHEHVILKSKIAKCRTATFFTELWVRTSPCRTKTLLIIWALQSKPSAEVLPIWSVRD